MSLTKKKELSFVAKQVCRNLRRDSTRAERMLWEEIRSRRFLGLKFYRQHPFFVDADGHETFFVADFYCHEQKLVIELDGNIHANRRRQDSARTKAMNEIGISVVRFNNQEVEQNIAGVLTALSKVIGRPRSLFKRRGRG
jgi:very-short-patch-repair endonuclease